MDRIGIWLALGVVEWQFRRTTKAKEDKMAQRFILECRYCGSMPEYSDGAGDSSILQPANGSSARFICFDIFSLSLSAYSMPSSRAPPRHIVYLLWSFNRSQIPKHLSRLESKLIFVLQRLLDFSIFQIFSLSH